MSRKKRHFDVAYDRTEELLTEVEHRLAELYSTAELESRGKLIRYLSQFEAEDEHMRALLRSGKITAEEYADWRHLRIATGKQFQTVIQRLAQDYVAVDSIAMDIVRNYVPAVYVLNHNFALFEAEVMTGMNIRANFTLYSRSAVERLMFENVSTLPMPRVSIPDDLRWNQQHIRTEIAQGIVQGESIPKIAGRLRNVTDMDRLAAVRNARTAITGAQNGGRLDAYERLAERGVKVEKRWIATLDDRTRHTHRELDGTHVGLDEEFANGCRFPGDPDGDPEEVYNCRCGMIAFFPGVNVSEGKRAEKLDGKSYDDWMEEGA